ncbi:hypothetical protein [Neptuniibacter sp.]|uniref:hypothetical protein n=1 Tax=Neptuniibacter sp. TaxID=1962643 RepID=UPI00261D8CEE|nr:hypothetical protein [Neptuniibacter sp.]MCP4595154.1 glycosyltransferase family 39 protein [Neptuniibacter sp.]
MITDDLLSSVVNKLRLNTVAGAWFWLAVLFTATYFLRIWQYSWAVNDDGVVYIYTAKSYLESGWEAAFSTFQWPIYSVLIAKLSPILQGDLVASARLINFLLQALLVWYLYKLSGMTELHKKHRQLLIAFFIVSIAFFNFRVYILRDQGFLTLCVIGLYYGAYYLEHAKPKHLIVCLLSFMLATLFRVEAAFLLTVSATFLPLMHKRYWLSLILLLLGSSLLMLPGLLLSYWGVENLFSYSISAAIDYFADISVNLDSKKQAISQYIFHDYWQDYSSPALFFMYAGVFLYYLLGSLSIYILAAFYLKGLEWNSANKMIALVSITVIGYCIVFMLVRDFLIFRYNLLLTYLLTFLAIYLVIDGYIKKRSYHKLMVFLVLFLPLAKIIDTPSGSKRLLLEANEAILNYEMPNPQVLSNAVQISLINDVPWKTAARYRNKPKILLDAMQKPLLNNQALIHLGYTDTDLKLHEANCLAYSETEGRRKVVLVLNRSHCK